MLLYGELSSRIIKSYYNVYNRLGYGFLEKVYERAMMIELRDNGLVCESQRPIEVFYKDQSVGYYLADIVVDNKLIVEIKSASALCPEREAQLTNYLKATEIEVGLLLNFGQKPEYKRKLYTSDLKNPS